MSAQGHFRSRADARRRAQRAGEPQRRRVGCVTMEQRGKYVCLSFEPEAAPEFQLRDRVWFERHPGRQLRMRPSMPDEIARFARLNGTAVLTQCPPGFTVCSLVEQVRPGFRQRRMCAIRDECLTDVQVMDDEQLRRAWAELREAPEPDEHTRNAAG